MICYEFWSREIFHVHEDILRLIKRRSVPMMLVKLGYWQAFSRLHASIRLCPAKRLYFRSIGRFWRVKIQEAGSRHACFSFLRLDCAKGLDSTMSDFGRAVRKWLIGYCSISAKPESLRVADVRSSLLFDSKPDQNNRVLISLMYLDDPKHEHHASISRLSSIASTKHHDDFLSHSCA